MKKELPLVSIIVPVYNVEKYLKQCLDSLISQTLRNIEIICVNDASPDNSLAILKEYEVQDERIIVIDLKENIRQGGARNRGIERARAKYIAFVDSDDWVVEDMYEKLYESAVNNDADIVNCDYYEYRGDSNIKRYIKYQSSIFSMPKEIANKYFILFFPAAWSNLYKKEVFIKDEIQFPENTFWEDAAIMPLTFLLADKIVKVSEALCYYRLNNYSTSRRKNDCRFFERLVGANLFLQNMKRFGFYETYKEEIEYQYINQAYDSIVWGCLNDFRPMEIERIETAKKDIKNNIPDFQNNQYYKAKQLTANYFVVKCITINTRLGIMIYKLYDLVYFIVKRKMKRKQKL